jgi:uncharacterized protein YciI
MGGRVRAVVDDEFSLHQTVTMIFAILYTPGPNWVAGRRLSEQDLQAHRDYLANLAKQGSVDSHGPFADSSGGMVILKASGAAEADRFIAADPAIIDGVFVAVAREWRVAYRKESLKDSS